jgi:2-C-methyl-D-erythritol 4-phosphate cytidylyltransferase
LEVLHSIVEGGNTRFQSVKNGLELVPQDSIVAIHDGVRPFVTKDTIDRCFTHATTHKTAIPVIELVDSIRFVEEDGNRSMNRANFRLVQTPQAFQSSLLKAAYEQPYSELFTDDASVVESFGEKVNLVDGNRENIKITTTYDLELSKFILQQKR